MKLLPLSILPLLLTASLAADDHEPLYLMAGVSHPSHAKSNQLNEFGSYVGFGYVSGTPGIFQSGEAGVDIEWRHSVGHGNTLNNYDVCYSERLFGLIGDMYLGYGVGSSYNTIKRSGIYSNESGKGWRIVGKLMAGYDLGGGAIFEATYFVSGEVADTNTNGVSLALGFWF